MLVGLHGLVAVVILSCSTPQSRSVFLTGVDVVLLQGEALVSRHMCGVADLCSQLP